MDAYEVLGLEPGADAAAIRAAYRAQAKLWHPDRHRGQAGEAEARERMKAINAAYAQLRGKPGAASAGGARARAGERARREADFDRGAVMDGARVLMSQDRTEDALQLLTNSPLYTSDWYYLIGLCRMRLGDEEGAQDALRWAVRHDRGNDRAQTLYRQLNLRARRKVPWWRRLTRWFRRALRKKQ